MVSFHAMAVDKLNIVYFQCDNGWYGVDCSIPSVISSIRDWPNWLLPARIDVPDNLHNSGKIMNLPAVVAKKRPFIYVYDLPPDFNSLLFEGRHFKLECVNRIYDGNNATVWMDQLYGAQIALYESMLASPHRTLNGEEADFLFVPVLDSCIITRADDAPHLSMRGCGRVFESSWRWRNRRALMILSFDTMYEFEPRWRKKLQLVQQWPKRSFHTASNHIESMGGSNILLFSNLWDSVGLCSGFRIIGMEVLVSEEHMGLRSSMTLEYYKNAYNHIVEQYPYWNRSSGRDHIWFFSWDEGACYAPKEIWNSMMLVHWGNTNTKHNHSTTAYWADNWDKIPSDRRGIHPCFDPHKDLVLPAWKVPDVNVMTSKLWAW
ncbi:hypothetical protein TanjilG_15310 [Lupinus angustifolius]|uniref:Exostosin GT47 domain-containing protein n=1 Tax=Lupinus angustifolius TaxID=3871 RepID=A0A1J7HGX8_LUPAN|nr:hypothetical protein TanjilG_15310 [Lupinus angustifolius]